MFDEASEMSKAVQQGWDLWQLSWIWQWSEPIC